MQITHKLLDIVTKTVSSPKISMSFISCVSYYWKWTTLRQNHDVSLDTISNNIITTEATAEEVFKILESFMEMLASFFALWFGKVICTY